MKKLLLSLFVSLAFSGIAYAAVDLNTATKTELESVKGIGPSKAEAIIEYRKQHGSFKKIDDLSRIKGFGDKSVEKLRGEVAVGSADRPADK
ncbi:MAG: helix-hairpin-helix domain-containing protein [Gallionella sp.]|nr:helix-hairpin-helix domain-containing protein [Gallionella sp.]OIO11062.1 MAG: competence protein ComE [Gallionellaceae bacterium CG1_02_60_325]PIR09511.1 MAG: competence protein ComE [Gallionellaceae bacterium CG11_big_fil_rev_8_21_14_0_20_60_62]PIV48102.1 MAG: competence protein ComE [Gallionellaceae bacterium CG02_land_8_20_14_3_00_60_115]PIY06804.1 MAG: competence protein ComE [Gallionellaceae bacterium CG_4_10_14_3_um_filter_60_1069]PJC05408.1 MAG: competence protein ComE [Gallionellac